tara:strand:- start:34306 stop:34731 length:426 start_codon:yes stop_codon:yes gene_type:complete
MLMAVDVVGRRAPQVFKGIKLGAQFVTDRRGGQASGEGPWQQARQGWQASAVGQSACGAERYVVGQGQMQSDIRRMTCNRFAQDRRTASPVATAAHAAGGGQSAGRNQFGNRVADAGREPEVVGAQHNRAPQKKVRHGNHL